MSLGHEPRTINHSQSVLNELFDYLLKVLGLFQDFRFPPLHQPPPWGTRVDCIAFVWPNCVAGRIALHSSGQTIATRSVRLLIQPIRGFYDILVSTIYMSSFTCHTIAITHPWAGNHRFGVGWAGSIEELEDHQKLVAHVCLKQKYLCPFGL